VIVPATRRIRLRDVAAYGAVFRVLLSRDIRSRYKQSFLGPLWLVFQPLALLAAFSVVFSNNERVAEDIPYGTYALVGLSVWAFFQASMTMGTASIVGNFMLVRRTPCPRFAFALSGALSSLPTLVLTLAAMLIVVALTASFSWQVLVLPFLIAWLILLTIGAVALTSALAVQFRDVVNAMPFLLQVGVFMAPIAYELDQLGGIARSIVMLNPLTGLIEAWHWAMLPGIEVESTAVAISATMTLVTAVAGWRVFTRYEPVMADVI
jgi:lipopolysaccharide transport system permease protein